MFKPVESRVSFPQLEEKVLAFWKDNKIFEKSIEARKDGTRFTFYEGPPFANGSPGIHHVLARAFKDIIVRYKVMKGYYVPRIAGWDTQGLPVELEVERQLGFSGKDQIENYGVEEFNKRCRESVFKYLEEWNILTERIAYWVDLDNAYKTMDNTYIESVWWAIKQIWDKGLIYQGYKVTPHCPRCGTTLSSHEVALGYEDDTEDPSVYIKFEVTGGSSAGLPEDKPVYLLAWTTTPWTLPGNTALAVAPDAEYVLLEGDDEYLVMAAVLAGVVDMEGYQEVNIVPGSKLVGILYRPLYNPHEFGVERLRFQDDGSLSAQEPDMNLNYRVISGDFVTLEDGTGIVHIAPAYGEVDHEAGKEWGLDFVQQVDLQGNNTGTYTFAGKFVKDADEDIIADLQSRGLMFRSGTIKHTYPFCWRCEAPLLYYAKQTWYIRTTAVKDAMISGNQEINWYPEHIKNGRFGDWLQNNIDWAFSRERYWGTPLPVWRCEECGAMECVGSVDELKNKPGFTGFREPMDLHRPYMDEIYFSCEKCGGKMQRTPEVMDCWFDSGAMPFAQLHYPYENRELFDNEVGQADFICEAVDQTRGWFYSLHAISTLLFNRPVYKNCMCLELILDAQGKKMSKSRRNVVEPADVVGQYGADALRWYFFTATHPGVVKRFATRQVAEISRRFLSTLWNVYSFFVLYANIDNYRPGEEIDLSSDYELDRWIISELNQLIMEVDSNLVGYNPTDAGRKIEAFVDRLSNWYVRRSRRRFWKSENDADKLSAYHTLYHCLVTISKLLAPFTPFLAEEIYQNLVKSVFPSVPESVHLTDYSVADESKIDKQLSDDNRLAMRVSSLGRAARSKAGIKVRQPLEDVYVGVSTDWEKRALERVTPLILEELNVKELYYDSPQVVAAKESSGYAVVTEANNSVAVSTAITVELEAEGMAREIVHRVQNMRRSAGYEIADHIHVYYEADAFIMQSLSSFADYVMQETLALNLEDGIPDDVDAKETYKVSGYTVALAVKKAG
ncbi:MAG TPA: isoleucine--tRNA ligase [Dehalococcoidia bacterium]|nr:isoleucine--tRNA ligase [Dehalococcoidia bacterium]